MLRPWKLLLLVVTIYTSFLWTSVCPVLAPGPSDVSDLTAFPQLVCKAGDNVRPHALQFVDTVVKPRLSQLDKTYGIHEKTTNVWNDLDDKLHLRELGNHVNLVVEVAWIKVRFYAQIAEANVHYYLEEIDQFLSSNPWYQKLISLVNRWVSQLDELLTPPPPLKAEDNPEPEPIESIAQPTLVAQRDEADDEEVAAEAQPEELDYDEADDDAQFEEEHYTSFKTETETVIESGKKVIRVKKTPIVVKTRVTETLTETPTVIASMSTTTTTFTSDGTKVIQVVKVPVVTKKKETRTLTQTVVVSEQTVAEVAKREEPQVLADTHYIDQVLDLFGSKVNVTIELATSNLEDELSPFLTDLIGEVKPKVQKVMQRQNKKISNLYRQLNQMLSDVGKDYEAILELGDPENPELVSRQQFRDKIAETYQAGEEMGQKVTDIMAPAHTKVLKHYIKVLQSIIDVLDLFADTTVSEYSRQLTAAIEQAQHGLTQSADEWQAWRRFHETKELIFEYRDYLYDAYVEYRDRKGQAQVVVGLGEWADFVQLVDFHVNTLVNDNDQYLQLVRAKGNVQFQLREGLVLKLLEEKDREAKQQQEREKAEREKAEREEAEVEEAEREEREEVEDADVVEQAAEDIEHVKQEPTPDQHTESVPLQHVLEDEL